MKPIPDLNGQHSRVRIVASAKRVTRVEHIPLVCNIRPHKPHRKVLAEILSQRQIQRVITRQMARPVTIQKSRAIVNGDRTKAVPRQVALDSCRKRIPLVVIQVEGSLVWG